MAQPIVEEYFGLMENLDLTLANQSIQPSLSTEEIFDPICLGRSTSESLFAVEFDVDDFNILSYLDQDFGDLVSDFPETEQFSASSPLIDEITALLTENVDVLHSTESHDMADPIQSTDEQLAMNKSTGPTQPIMRSQIEKSSVKSTSDQSISLSDSVAVTVPTPNQLQLLHGLEDVYRPRYKSDYFPQKGAARRPRYVTDCAGNHFITVQMPAEYPRDLRNEYVRIALITTANNNRGHFYSPYKFQTDNNDVKIPDQNPIYLPVQTYRSGNSTLRFHLVLIKSKLDQLKHAQPLKPFLDTAGFSQNIITEEKLSPKDLINKYQLDKSHLAFTLCTKLSIDTYKTHPETTVISSVITEESPKQSAASKKVTSEKKISCPNCSHCFDATDGEVTEQRSKRKPTSSTAGTSVKSATNPRTNKKKKTA